MLVRGHSVTIVGFVCDGCCCWRWFSVCLIDNRIDALRFEGECVCVGDDVAGVGRSAAVVLTQARVTRRWIHAIVAARWTANRIRTRADNVATEID